jgi:hypothetical protein
LQKAIETQKIDLKDIDKNILGTPEEKDSSFASAQNRKQIRRKAKKKLFML